MFNTYGSRRGNHEVRRAADFANIKLKNLLAEGKSGGWTRDFETGEITSIFDASQSYAAAGVPLVVLAGKMYGSGSSRDWAAKAPVAFGRARRYCRKLRAHSSFEPGGHGHFAAAVPRGRKC